MERTATVRFSADNGGEVRQQGLCERNCEQHFECQLPGQAHVVIRMQGKHNNQLPCRMRSNKCIFRR